jgi:hypothetical protein
MEEDVSVIVKAAAVFAALCAALNFATGNPIAGGWAACVAGWMWVASVRL